MDRKQICMYTSIYKGRSSAREIIESAVEFGAGGVELMNFCDELNAPRPQAAKELCRMARDQGLAIPCFSAAADMTTDAENAVETLRRYAEICAEEKIPLLHHTIALDLGAWRLTEEQREERFLRCVEPVLRLGEFARSLGVETVVEDQGFIFNGVRNCLRLSELSGEKIGLVADVGNILFVDEKGEDFIRAAGRRLRHVHLKDYRITKAPLHEGSYTTLKGNYLTDCEIGTGDVNYKEITAAFAEAGYAGMYALEVAAVEDRAEVERVFCRMEGERWEERS